MPASSGKRRPTPSGRPRMQGGTGPEGPSRRGRCLSAPGRGFHWGGGPRGRLAAAEPLRARRRPRRP
eukprot:10601888-Lingulodinium_polyedra.AAC.1